MIRWNSYVLTNYRANIRIDIISLIRHDESINYVIRCTKEGYVPVACNFVTCVKVKVQWISIRLEGPISLLIIQSISRMIFCSCLYIISFEYWHYLNIVSVSSCWLKKNFTCEELASWRQSSDGINARKHVIEKSRCIFYRLSRDLQFKYLRNAMSTAR